MTQRRLLAGGETLTSADRPCYGILYLSKFVLDFMHEPSIRCLFFHDASFTTTTSDDRRKSSDSGASSGRKLSLRILAGLRTWQTLSRVSMALSARERWVLAMHRPVHNRASKQRQGRSVLRPSRSLTRSRLELPPFCWKLSRQVSRAEHDVMLLCTLWRLLSDAENFGSTTRDRTDDSIWTGVHYPVRTRTRTAPLLRS